MRGCRVASPSRGTSATPFPVDPGSCLPAPEGGGARDGSPSLRMSTQPSRRPSSLAEPSPWGGGPEGAEKEARIAAAVEAFLDSVRSGGSLDPEPYLHACDELREDLAPLLRSVLRLESLALAIEPDAARPRGSDDGGAA